MRVIVAGSRNFNNYKMLQEKLDAILANQEEIIIVSGEAKGADQLGERYAKEQGYHIHSYPAAWEIHGRKAGMIRNEKMAKNADALVAFWDGKSRGTQNMITTAKRHNLPVRVIRF